MSNLWRCLGLDPRGLAAAFAAYRALMDDPARPLFNRNVLGGGPHVLGMLLGSAGAGALCGVLFLASRPSIRGIKTIIAAAAGFAPPRPKGRRPEAPVAELVDALDSKSSSARSAGSIPARGTKLRL